MTLEGMLEVVGGVTRLRLADAGWVEVGFARYGTTFPAAGPARIETDDGRVVAVERDRLRVFGGMAEGGAMFRVCEIDAREQPNP